MTWDVLKKIINRNRLVINTLIFMVLSLVLSKILIEKHEEVADTQWLEIFREHVKWLPLLLVMTILNWASEAFKWKLLVPGKTFWSSFRAVLTGLVFKQLIPFGIGDFSGRILSTPEKSKTRLAGAFFLSGIVQFLVSVTFGIIGVFWLIKNTTYQLENKIFVSFIIVIFLISGLWVFRNLIFRVSQKYLVELRETTTKLLLNLIFWSALRYLIFFIQALILFKIFNESVDLKLLMAGISFMYLAKTILPSFGFLGDLGVREFSVVVFFDQFGVSPLPVVIAALAIWLINIFLPSFVALFFIRKLKFSGDHD